MLDYHRAQENQSRSPDQFSHSPQEESGAIDALLKPPPRHSPLWSDSKTARLLVGLALLVPTQNAQVAQALNDGGRLVSLIGALP